MLLRRQSGAKKLLTEKNKERIARAIQQAEKNTSGEVRLYIEGKIKKKTSVFNRAVEVFHQLGMQKTTLRTGVLVYVALDDREFAIIGDQGIHEKVRQDFWDKERDEMIAYFKQGDIIGGIVYFIGQIGIRLQEHFPYQKDDVNELGDEVSVVE